MTTRTVLRGIGVGTTAAVGPAVRFAAPIKAPADEPAPKNPQERAVAGDRVEQALLEVSVSLQSAADQHPGETLGEVLMAAAEMASDPELANRSKDLIGEGQGPATAVTNAVAEFALIFEQIGGYMAERVADLHSVRDRAVAKLLGLPEPGLGTQTEPSVIIAHELTPADTSSLDMSKVLALVTEEGGPTSHTAIIARQLGLPCVVRVKGALGIPEGAIVAVDSGRNVVIVEPDQAIQNALAERMERRKRLLLDDAPGETADGRPIQLLANIGTVADAESAAQAAVEGVGLFRTEFMFLEAKQEPTVADQAAAYRKVLEAFAGRKVVIRTLDAGADKPLAYANLLPEANPALGQRAYRLVRSVPHLMTNQLTALAQAIREVPQTEAWVMAPMISTAAEAVDFRERATQAGLTMVGIMVEVPGAALCADQVLSQVDFASIGTNDLAQYTMATDREQGSLSDLIDRWQPAVLKLVAQTAEAGQRLGKPVGVCGESASDPLMAMVLCGLGINSLSMSAVAVPAVRYALRHTTFTKCQEMAQAAMAAASAEEAVAAVLTLLNAEVKEAMDLD